MKILTEDDVRSLLRMPTAIALMRDLFTDIGRGTVVPQPRTAIELRGGRDSVLFMPGHVASLKRVGLKVVSVFPDNPSVNGSATIHATILLHNGDTGEIEALMGGKYITALRTGAVCAVAADLLATRDSVRLCVFGAGAQARTQIEGILNVRPITHVTLFDPETKRASELAHYVRNDIQAKCRVEIATTSEEAVTDADIVVTATTSPTPVFAGRFLKPGAHINAIGSFQPTHRELDDETVKRSRIFVDSRDEALSEAGDLIQPLQRAVIRPEAIESSLGELIVGVRPGRRNGTEITLFKSVGLAVEDIMVASHVLTSATEAAVGRGPL